MALDQLLLPLALVMVLAIVAWRRFAGGSPAVAGADTRHLVPGIDVGGQIFPGDVGRLKAAGYRTLINMRPDGESPDQPASSDVQKAAADAGLAYAYVPTSAANLSDETIDRLGNALAAAEGPVLIYCRSGTRVARAWALAEASKRNGLDRDAIVQAVEESGFKLAYLLPRIEARLAVRPK